MVLLGSGCALFVSTSDLSSGNGDRPEGGAGPGADTGGPPADGAPEDAIGADASADTGPSGYVAAVLADSPAMYLRFEETTGTVAHSDVLNGPAGSFSDPPMWGAPGALDDGSHGVALDGEPWIDLGDVFPRAGNSPYTLEAWMKPSVVGDTRFLFDRGPTERAGSGYTVYYGDGYLLSARIDADGGEFGYATLGASPAVDVWSHVVVTYDGTSARMYLNGALIETKAAGPIGTGSPGRFAIGNSARGQTNKLTGVLDEVAIYETALSGARIAAHYTASGRR